MKASRFGLVVVDEGEKNTPSTTTLAKLVLPIESVARVSQGVIFGVVLTNPGSGYTSSPTITFRDPSPRAKGAVATINYAIP